MDLASNMQLAFNIWEMLLAGIIQMIEWVVIPLFGGVGAYHRAMGLGNMMLYNAKVVFEMMFLAVGNFDLTIVGICFFLTIVLWLIMLAIKTYQFIQQVIGIAAKLILPFL